MSDTPLIPVNAPFSDDQRAWLNGYLAGLLAAGALNLPKAGGEQAALSSPELVILYGTQTGTAEALSHRIAREAKGSGFAPKVLSMADHQKLPLEKTERLLVVTSTYGDGEMPDNAREFWDFLNSESAPKLEGVHYSVLALGDKNYTHFCRAGRQLDERLTALGARCFHPRVECDVDYEEPAMNWTKGALQQLAPSQPSAPTASPTATPPAPEAPPKGWTKSRPYPARLSANVRLNAEGSGKETRHFEIDLGDSGIEYEAGDALGVIPRNDPVLVERVMGLAGCRAEDEVPVPSGGTRPLHEALLYDYDISKPGKEFLTALASKSGNDSLSSQLQPSAADELKKFLWGRSIAVLLAQNPKARFEAVELIGLLRKLQPRLYSISSSLLAHPQSVHLTVGIVRYEAHGLMQGGVCSTFLADRAREGQVPVFAHKSPGFKLPTDADKPVIMVGPGTGIAPFRAFLEERQAKGAKGKNWLFFGEQHAATDFYYRDQLLEWQKQGHLTRLDTAFSRDQERKIYVQDRLMEQAATLWAWLEEGAHFYVCGDASRMAKDVDAALHRVIEAAGGLEPDAATAYINSLKTSKRYQRDVY